MMTVWEDSRVASYMESGEPGRIPSFLSRPDGYEPRDADYPSAPAGANRYAGRGSAMLHLLMLLGIAKPQPVKIASRRNHQSW